jgi:hypothetical protein
LVDGFVVPADFGGIWGGNALGASKVLIIVDDEVTVFQIEIHLNGPDVAASFGLLFLVLLVLGDFGLVFKIEYTGK